MTTVSTNSTSNTHPNQAGLEVTDETEQGVVAQLAMAASIPAELNDDRLLGRVVPAGWSFEWLDLAEWIGDPRWKTRGPLTYDAQSLIDYTADQAETPRLYAEIANGCIVAVFDDHHDLTAGRKDHRAVYQVRHTAEWEQLAQADGQFTSAQGFADLIEDLQHVIAAPSTADLLDLVRRFKASKIAQLTEHHDEKSGDRVFRYETETQISDELIAPDEFIFALPIYRGQANATVRARFRYRAGSGGVQFGLRLIQRELVLEEAFETEIAAVEAGVPDAGRAIRGTCS